MTEKGLAGSPEGCVWFFFLVFLSRSFPVVSVSRAAICFVTRVVGATERGRSSEDGRLLLQIRSLLLYSILLQLHHIYRILPGINTVVRPAVFGC